jgi:hypothetical protein
MDFFENIRHLIKNNRETDALKLLLACSEPHELGLGFSSSSKRGSTIGQKLARDIVSMYKFVPQLSEGGLNHIEEVQMVVRNISNDRISDITYAVLKGYFIKFTGQQSLKHNIPTQNYLMEGFYDFDQKKWGSGRKVALPYNPYDNSPIVLAPVNLLRHLPWINYGEYCHSYYRRIVLPPDKTKDKLKEAVRFNKEAVLEYNRKNYVHVMGYVAVKEKAAAQCKPEPFTELAISEEALRNANRSLALLEKQVAIYNSSLVPTHLQIDWENKQVEVRRLEDKVEELKKRTLSNQS